MAYHTTTLKVTTYSIIRAGLRLAYSNYRGNVLELLNQKSAYNTLVTCGYYILSGQRYTTKYRPLYIIPRMTRGYTAFDLRQEKYFYGVRNIVNHILNNRR